MPNHSKAIEEKLLTLVSNFLHELHKEQALRILSLNAAIEKDLGIGSLERVELFHRIEKLFQIQFPTDVIWQIDTLQALAKIIQAALPSSYNFTPDDPKRNLIDTLNATQTLREVLIYYAQHFPQRPFLYLFGVTGGEVCIRYADLYNKALDEAEGLIKSGLKPNETVAVLLPNGEEWFYAYFGILLAGGVPLPIDLKTNQSDHDELLTQIRAYGTAITIEPQDSMVSCLPFHTNLGLIAWLVCFYYGIPLFAIPQEVFLKRPEQWLWAIHYKRATLTIAPDYAYELCNNISDPKKLIGLDLRHWRLAIDATNSNQLDAKKRFVKSFSRYGLRKDIFYSSDNLNVYFADEFNTKHNIKYRKPFLQRIFKKCFYYFEVGAKCLYSLYVYTLLSISVWLPWLGLFVLPAAIAARLCSYWARVVCCLAGFPVKIEAKENQSAFSGPVIYAVNHSSYLDPLVTLASLPSNSLFVAKAEVLQTPIVRTYIRKLGHPTVNRLEATQSLSDAKKIIEKLQQGYSLIIFPEGTFTHAKGLRPFKLGAFKMAVETQRPICPVAINGTRIALPGNCWLFNPKRITVTLAKPILPNGYSWQEIVRMHFATRAEIAKHCGEPSIEVVMAGLGQTDLS